MWAPDHAMYKSTGSLGVAFQVLELLTKSYATGCSPIHVGARLACTSSADSKGRGRTINSVPSRRGHASWLTRNGHAYIPCEFSGRSDNPVIREFVRHGVVCWQGLFEFRVVSVQSIALDAAASACHLHVLCAEISINSDRGHDRAFLKPSTGIWGFERSGD